MHLRSSRYLSPEDLIFLIRDDTRRVNRLRLFLSWKEIRKRAKEDDTGGQAGEDLTDMDLNDKTAKAKKMAKLPWETMTPFTDLLRSLPGKQREDEEADDEDEMQAYRDNLQRLRVCFFPSPRVCNATRGG
jgi:transcription initiation protein SPT3